MSPFIELYEVSQQLFELVAEPPKSAERDSYIEKINVLVAKRESILKSIDRDPTEGEKELLKKAVEWNEQMTPRLQAELQSIKRDMLQLKKKKETGRRYENPYAYAPIDGAFIDKKN